MLVRTARHALLFDAGPRFSLESDAGHRVLVPLLQRLQERLDVWWCSATAILTTWAAHLQC